ncbi:LANO_0F01332g1_1 [Lachancea nothofagi CBS 11611]|uniref:LANO_0F01332g1_1 n=1 Tax=Lachancea nothofagi CBS 11611 TaxID=1266666 RepID=A0A1G4K630_9SACH|nr:LANO_0F01332g1_1 [Lachancea nothofagi CBS 11611]
MPNKPAKPVHIETTVSSTFMDSSMDLPSVSKKQETQHFEFAGDSVSDADFANTAVASDTIAKFLGLSEDARRADGDEKHMSLLQAIRQYPKAALWSVVLSSALIMEGYDTTLLSSLFALPAFAQKFGNWNPVAQVYEVPAKWQTALSMCTNIGELFGLQLAGIVAERIGYRYTLIGSLSMVFGFIFILFFAPSCAVLAVGEILCGIPWGAFQTLTVTYATEVCPLALRYYLTTYVNICWILGQIMASGILKNSQENLQNSDMGYRLPFALQWIWPIPIAIGIYLAPESPWWLVKKGRMDQAAHSLDRLVSGLSPEEKPMVIDAMLNKIQLTVQKEEAVTKDATYWDCFKGADGRRTRIACLTWVTQNACGSAMMGYSTYFYTKAGLDSSMAFTFSIIQYCLGLIGTTLSWGISKKYGRFTIFSTGLAVQLILLVLIGGLGFSHSKGSSWAIGSLLLAFVFAYDVGVGPVTYCVVPEIPSNKLRTKTVILARNCYNLMGIINYIWTPYMLNSEEWNWGAKTGLFWAGICGVMLAWAIWDLPETKDRTFGEIDELFHLRVPARKFKSTEVNPFDSGKLMAELGDDQIERIVKNDDRAKSRKMAVILEDSD